MPTRSRPPSQSPTYQDARNALPLPNGPNILRFGHGLDLCVRSADLKVWRCKVQRDGRQTTITLGHFPSMSIVEARAKRLEVRNTADPVGERQTELAAPERTFQAIAERWIAARASKARWTERYHHEVQQNLARHVYPKWGARPVADISPRETQELIANLHRRTPIVAVLVKQYISAIFDFAWANDDVPFNPAKKMAHYMPTRMVVDGTPNPGVRTIAEARAVLHAVEQSVRTISPWLILAHRLIALTAVRKMEALAARWEEFDLDAGAWAIPAERMKGRYGYRRTHIVALSPQAVAVVKAAAWLRKCEFVFPSRRRTSRKKHADERALNFAMEVSLKRAKIGRVMVPHGWRSTFSTIMNERSGGADFRIIDAMLAHKSLRDPEIAVKGRAVEGHYNFAQYLVERRRIACAWADMLLEGAPTALGLLGIEEDAGTNVVQLRRATP